MRRDGDRLIEHLSSAKNSVLLCAPFIKVGVMKSLLRHIPESVTLKVITRWVPLEIAVGVSDLEIFDLLQARNQTSLWLYDRLHAKLYMADDRVLAGSANLTATALGWSSKPNLEILTALPNSDEAVKACLAQLAEARPASSEERDKISRLAASVGTPKLGLVDDVEDAHATMLWLPTLAAPAKLYQAYVPQTRDRLTDDVLDAALEDLAALSLPAGLGEAAFRTTVAAALQSMPAIQRLLHDAADDLTDDAAQQLIRDLARDDSLSPEARWLVVREWLTYFLQDNYEIAPQSFVLRRRPGSRRS